MTFNYRQCVRGCLSGRKYKITIKPLKKLAIDLETNTQWILYKAGVITDPRCFVWEYTADNIEKLCDYLGVPPNKIFSFELI